MSQSIQVIIIIKAKQRYFLRWQINVIIIALHHTTQHHDHVSIPQTTL